MQLLDKNMLAAEKQNLSSSSSSGVTKGGSPSHSLSAPPPPSSPSLPGGSAQDSAGSLASVVEIAVRAMAECVEVAEAMKEEMSALVAPAPPSLVDAADFECVLCTG